MTKVKTTEAFTIAKTRAIAQSKFIQLLNNDKKGKNMEILVYNNMIEKATEKCIAKNWKDVKFRRLYLEKFRSLVYIIQKFPEIRKMKVSEVFKMKREDINPDLWNPIIKKCDAKREKMIKQLPKEEDTHLDGLYTCPECKSQKTSFYTMQVKSADEPETEFCMCLSCQYTWSNDDSK